MIRGARSHTGAGATSLHRGQHQRRVIQAERTQGIYAPEAADREHAIRAGKRLKLLHVRRETTKFGWRFLTILNRR